MRELLSIARRSPANTGTDGSYSYSPANARTYIDSFFSNVGGSPWDNINSQYCQGVAFGTVTCGSPGVNIENLGGQFKGFVDTSNALPLNPTQSEIAAEAVVAATHSHYTPSSQPKATFFVLTPSGDSISGFATSWCAWHSSTSDGGVSLPYAYLPYQPDRWHELR